MDPAPRHQCLIYDGPPSRQLSALAATVSEKLRQNFRCLYLNTKPMVAGMRSYAAAAGVDVTHEMTKGSLLLSSDRGHLVGGRFDPQRMMQLLNSALEQALNDGYVGLWATGDMTWQMGPDRDFARLLEYEWQLERFFRTHPQLSGVCQYHADTLPRDRMRQGLMSHPGVFINETLSLVNPHFIPPESFTSGADQSAELNCVVGQLCGAGGLG
ncbi:MAG TPA: MEDS domain-containing protein [Acidobacteriaceae bacterium]|jgi:hypothetical protein|nr:MEDS domain-containing protein [Acidobacteriaceae bacterium]